MTINSTRRTLLPITRQNVEHWYCMGLLTLEETRKLLGISHLLDSKEQI